MTNFSLYNTDVAMNAILYIIERMGGKVDLHKLYKTLYFADREHLSKYGRSITKDDYIAMQYGPVPSRISDILKAVIGESFFSNIAEQEFGKYIRFFNKIIVELVAKCDESWLSETDKECLNFAIDMCKDLNFNELTNLSHDLAWGGAWPNRKISISDMLREKFETEEYIDYVKELSM